MNIANEIVAQAVGEQGHENVPTRVREIVDRHRETLLDLANALLAAGRNEEEVVRIILKASESFSMRLNSETKGLQS